MPQRDLSGGCQSEVEGQWDKRLRNRQEEVQGQARSGTLTASFYLPVPTSPPKPPFLKGEIGVNTNPIGPSYLNILCNWQY